MSFLRRAPRHLFFTGKGGVGKTSIACATAIALADRGARVLLVSTDPASNLDEVLGTRLGPSPRPVEGIERLSALNIDPEAAAHAYRERLVGPYRGVLPDAAVRSIEEQLSGACTVEIAAFDEFSKLLGEEAATASYDHIIFDTAPTGHTLRLLELPAAWSGFLASNAGGTSCLGPLAGLATQQTLYESSRRALTNADATSIVLVSRPERSSLVEAERTHRELVALGIWRMELVLNGLFKASDPNDPIARAFEARGREAVAHLPTGLASLPRTDFPLFDRALLGIEALRTIFAEDPRSTRRSNSVATEPQVLSPLASLIPELARSGGGVVMTMGKGGVGKTSVAVAIAVALARRGLAVHLTTTDPAAHVEDALGPPPANLRVSRIDPAAETKRYVDEVMRVSGAALDDAGRALLEEDLRSPCTEEVAVFRAFARVVEEGERGFVVIDTAPTGHTLLLLDAAESYHREVLRTSGSNAPDDVRRLLPRLRDPDFTRIVLITTPEATPVHEASALARDLARAEIQPFAWVVNQALSPWRVSDPVLRARRALEGRYIREVEALAPRAFLVPWTASVAQPGKHLDATSSPVEIAP